MYTKIALVMLMFLIPAVVSAGVSNGKVKPEGYIKDWVILGPFPNPERAEDSKDRGAFDVDYLKSIGGEAKARIKAGSAVTWTSPSGESVKADAKRVKASGTMLDFCANYTNTDNKLVYAYTEIESPAEQEALLFLGSDDGAKVWVNGKLMLDMLYPRACTARQDRFKVKLHRGANSVLVKVENGAGDWKLVLEAYGKEQGSKIEAELKTEENKRAFQNQQLGLSSDQQQGFIVWPRLGPTPTIIWRDVDTVRKLAGKNLPLKVRWFDSNLKEVPMPQEPGRHAAYIESKLPDGTPVRRALTFYCATPDFTPWVNWQMNAPYPGKPINPDVWKEQSEFVAECAGSLYLNSLLETEQGAIFLAGMAECKPNGKPLTFTESPEVLNDDYQLALKLKLMGVADKVKPLAEPKLRTIPAPVLHEGSISEAGVKWGAKEKIDAICQQWAEDSGEPFTILVARHGVIVTHAAFGKTGDGTPVTLDYRTDIASITKAISGILFSQFLDQEYVKLEDPIGKVVPGFPVKGEHALTFRNLFTHTSGLSGHGEWGGIHNSYLDNVVLNGLDYIHPGRAHNYNGMGYDLAGKAMEYMTGKSIVRLFHENLFRPLGIQSMRVDDLAYGARPTAYELGILGQWLANHGSYGDKQFISEETFQKLLPVPLKQYYPRVDVDWGIGLTWFRETRPGSKDLIFGEHVIGHGSASSCILRVDLDKDLVIVQVRRTAGPKYGEYLEKFLMAVADSMER